jgi:hypothetical protein
MIPNVLQHRDNDVVADDPWLVTSHKKTDEIWYHQLRPSVVFVSAKRETFLGSPTTRFCIFIFRLSLEN